jgi:hypothetical protein
MSYHEEIDRLIYCETELEYSDFKLVVNINKNKNHHIKTFSSTNKTNNTKSNLYIYY